MKNNLVRRILSFALAGALILGIIPSSVITAFAATEYTNENFKYTVSNGEATITGCVDENIEVLSIPVSIEGYAVSAIGANAFDDIDTLTTIYFNKTIKTIGRAAFKDCDQLFLVEIPDSVETIEGAGSYDVNGAFANCDNLHEVIIGDGLKTISKATFYGCPNLESVVIGRSVETIGVSAFEGCGVKTILIPDSVAIIDDYAFNECKSMSAILFGSGLKSIGYRAFKDCDSLLSVNIPDSVETIDGAGSYEVTGAFSYCDNLQEVVIGDGLKTITKATFYGCPKLESVVIGSSVETIGVSAFEGCGIKTILIPDSVAIIDDYAFNECKSLQTIKLGSGLKTIGYRAFKDCDSLLYVNIPDSVETIEGAGSYEVTGAFSYCDNLQEVVIGDGLKTISKATFYGCTKLESVIIGNSVETIGTSAFEGCGVKTILIPDSVTVIDDYAFNECRSLYAIKLGSGVKTIGYRAFKDCDSLLSIEIPDSVETIEGAGSYEVTGAFSYCDNLQEVIIGNGLKTISKATFYGCSKLESVIIGDSVETIGTSAFEGCGVKTILVPDSVTVIDDYAFNECKSLYAIKLGSGVKTIGYRAFKDCDNLLSVEIPDSVEIIEGAGSYEVTGAFSYCDKLQDVIIGDGLKAISKATFYGCPELKTVIIGSGVESIQDQAFAENASLTTVLIFDNVTSIADNAFDAADLVEFYGYEGSYAQEYALAHDIPFHVVSRDLSIEEILAGITSRKVDLELITGEYIGTYTGPQGLMGLEFDVYYADDLLEDKTKLEEIAQKATIASIVYDDGKEIPQKVFSWRDIHTAVRNYSGSYIAIFYYFENAENEGVETGVYISTAKYNNEDNTYSFVGTEWLQHDTYDFADIKNATLDGDYIVGEIWGQGSSGGIWWGTTYQELGGVIVKKEGRAHSLPKDAELLNGHTYKLIEQNVTWKQAEVICKQMGGHLVTLNSSAEKTLFEKMAASTDAVWLGGYVENGVWQWSTGEDFVTSILDVEPDDGYLVYQNGEYFAATKDSTTYFICEWNYTNSGSLESSIKEGNALFNVFDYETFETVKADITYDDLNKTLTITAAGYNTVNLTDISCVSGQTYSFAMVKADSKTGIAAVWCNGHDALISNSVSSITDSHLNIKVYSALDNVLKYQIVQGKTIVAENTTGDFSIKSQILDKDIKVEIRIVDIGGNELSKIITKIYVPSFTSDSFKLTAGSKFDITMPDSFGGFTFGLNMDVIPLTYYDDGNTIKIGIGAKEESGESKEDKEERCNNLKDAIDQYCKKKVNDGKKDYSEYKELQALYKDLNSKGIMTASQKASGGFEIQVYGYLEIKYNENGFQSEYGKAVIIMSGEVKKEWQVLVGVVPIVLKAKMGAEVNTEVEVGYDFANSQWFCEGELEITLPEIKVSAGVGISHVADISIYGSAKNVVKLNTKEDTVSASVDGDLGVSASLLFAHFEKSIVSGSWQYYYKDKTGEYYFDQASTLRSLYRLSSYSVDRNYLNNRSGWNVGDVMLLSASGANSVEEIVTSKTLQESINYSATPKLIKLDDATEMLVWTMDIADRADGNHTAIVYSIHNVILDTWTDPAIIDDDGTADFYPEVLYSNGDVYVIWSDANKQFEEGFDLNDVVSSCEITYAVYGKYTKSFGEATTITADSTADVKPVLVDNNGKVVAVWLNNPNNDLLTQSGTNYLMLMDMSSGTDVQTVVTTDKPVLSVAPIVVDGQLAVAYTQDLDGDLMTTADVEVFVYRNGTSTQLTTNNESEGYLSTEVLNGKQCLVFYSDSGLKVSYDLVSASDLLGAVGTAEYDIVSQDGKDIIVYAVAAGEITQLYGCVVGNSTSEVLIGEVDGTVKDLAAVSSINGIVLSYVSSTQNTETLETSFNLCSATFDLFTDLTAYVNQDVVDHSGATLSVPVEITNTGMETVNGYIINVYDETDSLIHSQVIEEHLMVGETVTKTVTIDGIAFPEQIKDYVVEVLPAYGTVEGNTNSAIFSIGFIDLSIDVSSFGADENAVFLIDLKNNTGVATPATVVVKNEAGNIVKTYSVDQFDGEFSFIIRASELGIGDVYHFEVVGEREDAYLGNNSDTGYVHYNVVMGDVNSDGVVDTLDRMALSRYLANWDDASENFNMTAADVNGDGIVDTLDRMIVNRYLANWEGYVSIPYAG